MTTRWTVVVAALAGCWKTQGAAVDPPEHPAPADVAVDIASVSLADDCPEPGQANQTARAVSEDRSCDQTAMQIALKSTGDQATQIRIKKVELLDRNHQVVGTLAPRAPMVWSDNGYVAWDQTIAGGKTLKASYKLSAPNWSAVGGRWQPAGATFHVRVTLALGAHERSIEKQATLRAMPDPDVVT